MRRQTSKKVMGIVKLEQAIGLTLETTIIIIIISSSSSSFE
jgi:hypothetical protein